MDAAALSALAAALGAGLVEAMTTDAWQAVRDRISRIVGRGSAAREQEAVGRLEAARAVLLSGEESDAYASIKRSLAEEWTNSLKGILVKDPALATDVESVLKLIKLTLAASESAVTQAVSAGRDAFAAGGNQYIRINTRDYDE